MVHKPGISRRGFLKSTAFTAFGKLFSGSFRNDSAGNEGSGAAQQRITAWEYHSRSLGGVWEVWRGNKATNNVETRVWQAVQLPHCFNAIDAVDADHPYYEGQCWYRTRLRLANPFPNGRTLLHFEGSGQKSTVFVYLDPVGRHVGGYDEFVIDITTATSKFLNGHKNETDVPIAVLCDNSPDLEMIPSSLNDFNRYGGLYRHVNLVYAPAIMLERVHILNGSKTSCRFPRISSIHKVLRSIQIPSR
jgi:beta-galactosidase